MYQNMCIYDETIGTQNKEYLIGNDYENHWQSRQDVWRLAKNGTIRIINASINRNGQITVLNKNRSRVQIYAMNCLQRYNDCINYGVQVDILRILQKDMSNVLKDKETVGTIELCNHILKLMKSYLSYVKGIKHEHRVLGVDFKYGENSKGITVNKQCLDQYNDCVQRLISYHVINNTNTEDVYETLKTIVVQLGRLYNARSIDYSIRKNRCETVLSILDTMQQCIEYNILTHELITAYMTDVCVEYTKLLDAINSGCVYELNIRILTDDEREDILQKSLQLWDKRLGQYRTWIGNNKKRINDLCTRYKDQANELMNAFDKLKVTYTEYNDILENNYKRAELWKKYIRIKDTKTDNNYDYINDVLQLFRDLAAITTGVIGLAAGATMPVLAGLNITSAAAGLGQLYRKKTRDVYKEQLDKTANQLIDKYTSSLTRADIDIIRYICDYNWINQKLYIENEKARKKKIEIFRQIKINKINEQIKQDVYGQVTIKSNTYLQYLFDMQMFWNNLYTDTDIIGQMHSANGSMYWADVFVTVWLAAYECCMNNVDLKRFQYQRSFDIIFWTVIQDLAKLKTYRGKVDDNRDNIEYYESIKNYCNSKYNRYFMNKNETHNKVIIPKYIIKASSTTD